MEKSVIRSERLGEAYIQVEHPSGLTLMLYPMEGYSTAYALFAARVGSIDNNFRKKGEEDYIPVPSGIAHFLEHKMFDCEDGDAFTKYAKTGASANAYTSFDRTAYLFSCTDYFEESLAILLDFVSKPYFTQPSVDKEQGIIGQEIRMYDDDPDWQVYFNLLGALYQKHPIRLDIAGTVESIAEIDAAMLYRCYEAFYNMGNMVLSIAGNFDVDTVLRLCDEILPSDQPVGIECAPVEEPREVGQKRVEVALPVANTLFQVGFKCPSGSQAENFRNQILDEVLAELLAGETTAFYRELYDTGLINATFAEEVLSGRGFHANIFAGESPDPDQVYQRLCQRLEQLQRNGLDRQDFERVKKATYGRYIGLFSRPDSVASLMLSADFAGVGTYEILDVVSSLTVERLEERLRTAFSTEHSALSVVRPLPTDQVEA